MEPAGVTSVTVVPAGRSGRLLTLSVRFGVSPTLITSGVTCGWYVSALLGRGALTRTGTSTSSLDPSG